MALLATHTHDWVRRRVQQISYPNERSIRRRVSIDFTVPDWAGDQNPLLLPVAQFEKRPLTRFDFRDENNRPIPMLTRE